MGQRRFWRSSAGFDVNFDNYGSTNSPENEKLCGDIWKSIRTAGLVKEKDIEQLFDVQEGTFLADRFVRGTCPRGGARRWPVSGPREGPDRDPAGG